MVVTQFIQTGLDRTSYRTGRPSTVTTQQPTTTTMNPQQQHKLISNANLHQHQEDKSSWHRQGKEAIEEGIGEEEKKEEEEEESQQHIKEDVAVQATTQEQIMETRIPAII